MTGEMLTLYSMLDYYNYFYTKMPYSTKILTSFDLTLTTDKGVMLEYPSTFDMKIPEYTHMPQVLNVFDNYAVWAEKLGVKYVSEVNNVVINGKIKEFIELNEIKQNNDLLEIANKIQNNINDIKIVLIAGPSSSGKTTTCKKLALYLKSKGLNPFTLSTDDFFKDRKDTPKNEKGEYEYDIPEAIDIDLFNEKLDALLKGEETTLPTYNFLTGEKEYKHPPVSLKNRDLLIVEGIHTLNELLSSKIPRENKLKIYISPFTPLGLDRHNHVSTVDLRLIRRIVRDARTRGYNAVDTLKSWRNVRISEEKYIFPYQKEADIVLNTALIYELGILKTFAVPLLYNVNYKSEYYTEAKRIINFLKIFLNIPESKMIRIAINGFGRIGRIALRQISKKKDMEVVAINDLTDPLQLAYLYKYDSVHRTLDEKVAYDDDYIEVDGKKIKVFKESDPSKLPWKDLKVDLVLECTGAFTSKEKTSSMA